MSRQKGFTLIELVVVIVILGLLAATALPRFVDLTGNARLASVQGTAGGLRSAVALTRAAWLVQGSSGATSVTMDGSSVVTNLSGFPTGALGGIGTALPVPDGFTASYGATTTYSPNGITASNCQVVYVPATGAVTVSATATCS